MQGGGEHGEKMSRVSVVESMRTVAALQLLKIKEDEEGLRLNVEAEDEEEEGLGQKKRVHLVYRYTCRGDLIEEADGTFA